MSRPSRSRVVTAPLGGSALSLAVQTRRLPPALQPASPTTAAQWKSHVEHVRDSAPNGWLETLRSAMRPSGAAAGRLARAAKNGVVVTTGQQAGLFGGPLYTLSKAVSALALADAIEEQCGVSAAPVFWAATDDADFLEASVTAVADADGLRELRLMTKPPAGTPMSALELGDTTKLLDELRRACGSAAHAAFYEAARESFSAGHTLGAAYVSELRALLEPLGIAVLDSSHDACRAAARPVLIDALKHATDVGRASTDRSAAIRKAGFEPQVVDDRGLTLVFALENGVKRRLRVDEAEAFAKNAGVSLVPNVLLRPIVERAILPTVAYAAGPGELAYFTQVSAVADAMQRAQPTAVARWSCTVIEPFAARALERLGMEHHDLADLHAVERKLAREAMPAEVTRAWEHLKSELSDALGALRKAVEGAKLTPPAVIEGLQRSLDHRLSRGERRLIAAAKRRDERIRHDLKIAADALYPGANRQERVLNFIPMLARGGSELLDEMRREARVHADVVLHAGRRTAVAAR